MSREDVEAAFDKVEKETAPAAEVAAPVEEKPAEVVAPVEEKPAEEKPAEEKPAEEKPAEEKPVEEKPVEEKPAEQKLTPKIRAPESWKPAIREQHWQKLPPEVQAEIHRRERQIDIALQQSAEARKTHEQLSQVVSQYKDLFEFEKSPPMQSINNLLQISRTLRFAPPAQKAQMMANVIQGFNVDVSLLDQALAMVTGGGQQANQSNAALEAALQKHLAPIQSFMQNVTQSQQARQQSQQAEMQKEINDFANDPKNEYFDVVRDTMADILEAGASRGQQISLQDAYQRAILAHNDLASVVTQKSLSQAATQVNAPAARARQLAATSVTGAPSTLSPKIDDSSVRAALEAAVDRHSGRQ